MFQDVDCSITCTTKNLQTTFITCGKFWVNSDMYTFYDVLHSYLKRIKIKRMSEISFTWMYPWYRNKQKNTVVLYCPIFVKISKMNKQRTPVYLLLMRIWELIRGWWVMQQYLLIKSICIVSKLTFGTLCIKKNTRI